MLAEDNTSILTIVIPALVGLIGGVVAAYLLRRTNKESNETNFLAQAVEAWKVIAEAAKQDYDDLRAEGDQDRLASNLRIAELERQNSALMHRERHNSKAEPTGE